MKAFRRSQLKTPWKRTNSGFHWLAMYFTIKGKRRVVPEGLSRCAINHYSPSTCQNPSLKRGSDPSPGLLRQLWFSQMSSWVGMSVCVCLHLCLAESVCACVLMASPAPAEGLTDFSASCPFPGCPSRPPPPSRFTPLRVPWCHFPGSARCLHVKTMYRLRANVLFCCFCAVRRNAITRSGTGRRVVEKIYY